MADEYTITIVVDGENKLSPTMRVAADDMKRFGNETKNATTSASTLRGGISQLRSVVGGFIGAIAVREVVGFAEDMYTLGENTRTTRAQFVELSDDIGGSEEALVRLRAATGDVNSDLELMTASSHLLRTGLVDDSSELAKLVGWVQDLKPATQDLAEGVMTISQGMQTGSARGLNQFGLNVEAVQARIEALKDSGYSVQDAFKEAVYDEMATAVERLGASADADETALARLQIRLENIASQGAEKFASVINEAALSLERLAYISETGNFGALFGNPVVNLQADQETRDQAYARGQVIADAFLQGFSGGEYQAQYIRDFINELARQTSEQLAQGGGILLGGDRYDQIARQVTGVPEGTPMGDFSGGVFQQATAFFTEQYQMMERAAALNARNLQLESQRLQIATQEARETEAATEEWERRTTAMEQAAAAAERMAPIEELYQSLSTMRHETSLMRGGMFFTESEAATAERTVEAMETLLDAAKEQHDLDLINDDDFQQMQDMVGEARDWANEIDRGAEAFSKMSLSELLGQGSGGVVGELGDLVLSQLADGGLSDEALQAVTDAVDLASGQQTDASLALRDEVVPLLEDIYGQEGQDALVVAIESLASGIREAREQGATLDAETLMRLTGFQYTEGGGVTGTVEYGDTLYSLAGRYGGSIEDYRSLLDAQGILHTGDFSLGGGVEQITDMSGAVESMAINAPVAETAFAGMSESAGALQTSVDAVKGVLDEITSAAYTVTLDLAVNVPAILQWLFSQIGAGGGLEETVRARGGVVPGSDPRARPIEW